MMNQENDIKRKLDFDMAGRESSSSEEDEPRWLRVRRFTHVPRQGNSKAMLGRDFIRNLKPKVLHEKGISGDDPWKHGRVVAIVKRRDVEGGSLHFKFYNPLVHRTPPAEEFFYAYELASVMMSQNKVLNPYKWKKESSVKKVRRPRKKRRTWAYVDSDGNDISDDVSDDNVCASSPSMIATMPQFATPPPSLAALRLPVVSQDRSAGKTAEHPRTGNPTRSSATTIDIFLDCEKASDSSYEGNDDPFDTSAEEEEDQPSVSMWSASTAFNTSPTGVTTASRSTSIVNYRRMLKFQCQQRIRNCQRGSVAALHGEQDIDLSDGSDDA